MGQRMRVSKAPAGRAVLAVGVGQALFAGSSSGRVSEKAPGKAQGKADYSADELALVRRATEVLGAKNAASWLSSKIASLGDQTPTSLLKTEAGRSQVERVLLKIEHGVY